MNVSEETVSKFCDRMLTAAIGADWRQRAPESVTAFWMSEVRSALEEALAQQPAAVDEAAIRYALDHARDLDDGVNRVLAALAAQQGGDRHG